MISAVTFALMGLLILALTSTAVYAYGKGYGINKEGYVLSFRNLGPFIAAISIGMAWANSPALFVAPLQAYNVGLVGWFWFSFGNIITLMVFAYAAQYVRSNMPEGYTMAGYLREQHGNFLHKVYIIAGLTTSTVYLCVGIVAAATMISLMAGIDKIYTTTVLTCIALTLSFRTGFRATVLTEVLKFALIVCTLFGILAYLFYDPSIKPFTEGLGGIKGTGADIFGTANAWAVFATFGIITFVSQMSAPWADNNFIQRAFAFGGDKRKIYIAFIFGAIFFALVPISTGIIGATGVANGVTLPQGGDMQYIILYIINSLVGYPALLFYCFIVMLSTVSIVDSQLTNTASIVRNDVLSYFNLDDETALRYTRYALLISGALAIAIVNVSFVNLFYIFMLGGVIRGVMGLQTVGLVFKPQWFHNIITPAIMLVGIILAIVGYTYSNIYKDTAIILPMMLTLVFGTPLLSIVGSRLITKKD